MSKMDDTPHYECDLYVEDDHARTMLVEILAKNGGSLLTRSQIIPYGSSSVGQALGQMVAGGRFPRPSRVFLDGDKSEAVGCLLLPGQDAPERVVFDALRVRNWEGLTQRIGRPYAQVADSCLAAMNRADHHEWVSDVANRLLVSGDTLWQAMCAEWADKSLRTDDTASIAQSIQDAIDGIDPPAVIASPARPFTPKRAPAPATVQPPLFDR